MPIRKKQILRRKQAKQEKPDKKPKRAKETEESSSSEEDEKQDISKQFRERYDELIKDLWKNEKEIEQYDLPDDFKAVADTRFRLMLEYFIINACFHSISDNLFEYMESFSKTTKFF